MRILLAMVAFVISAALLGYGAWGCYFLFQLGFFSQPIEFRAEAIANLAILGGIVLVGFAFMAAGVAMLGSKPRRE